MGSEASRAARIASAATRSSGWARGEQRCAKKLSQSLAVTMAVCQANGSIKRFPIDLWTPRPTIALAIPAAPSEAARQVALAAALRQPVSSSPPCMPGRSLAQTIGTKGSSTTRRICLRAGMARELAELRLSILWVFSSARTKRAKVTSIVVRRTPGGLIESQITLAEVVVGRDVVDMVVLSIGGVDIR